MSELFLAWKATSCRICCVLAWGYFTQNAQFFAAGLGDEEDEKLTNELLSLGRSAKMGALVTVVPMTMTCLAGASRVIFGM